MDASNPVISSDRATIQSQLEKVRGTRRQDLGYLQGLASTTQRIQLPTNINIPLLERTGIVEKFKTNRPEVPTTKDIPLDDKIFMVELNECPVSGILNSNSLPLHPSGVNCLGGKVNVQRKVGGIPTAPFGLGDIVAVIGDDVLNTKHVYTSGTWSGFVKRLNQQMGRKTVSLRKTMGNMGKELSYDACLKLLDKYMPRKPNYDWPGRNEANFYEDLTTKIKVTMNSSAGAPYWRNKSECMEDIIDVGIPLIVKAIKENSLDKLYMENPEMFLCEVKNKTDRYEVSKLKDKTRPYTCVPAHWAFLFSMLTQGFQETLLTFDQDPSSSNAYGFSSSNGGLKRMVEWMYTADRRGKVVCYGDDACIVIKKGDKIYRIDPDFKQMDGSLSQEDIELTVKWVMAHFEKDAGKQSLFWRAVAGVWALMSHNPVFVIDGKTVYRKRNPSGLMTGVPGTTLFDTVKSVMVWNKLLDVCATGQGDILDEKWVTNWMLQNGLVVKEGTWKPEELPKQLDHGDLVTTHKFLGVQIKKIIWKGTEQFVPTIPYEDAVEMLVIQKDDPWPTNKVSNTMKARTLFDRMRGLMITMGFNHPAIVDCIHNVVNNLPPEVILMQVQNGVGEKPDHITLQEFNYPDSSGFPSVDFCISVYADGTYDEPWIKLFPNLDDKISAFKEQIKQMERKYRELLGVQDPQYVEIEDKPLNQEYQLVEAKTPVKPPKFESVNKRSKVCEVHDDRIQDRKYVPNLGQSVRIFLQKGYGLAPVGVVAAGLGVSARRLYREASNWGYYMTGWTVDDICSLRPIITAFKTHQEDIFDDMEGKKTLINKSTEIRQESLQKSGEVVRSAPDLVLLRKDILLFNQSAPVSQVDNADEAFKILNLMVSREGLQYTFTTKVDATKVNSVGVVMVARHSSTGVPSGWTPVAEAWSLNKKLAKEFIARSILEMNGIECEESKFSVTYVPPILEESLNWADEVENTFNPRQIPRVIDEKNSNVLPDLDVYQELEKLRPYIPKKFLGYAESLFVKPNPQEHLKAALEMLDKIDRQVHHWSSSDSDTSGVGSSSPSTPSKRSRLTPARRTKLNRKLTERRRRKKASSTTKP
ncbi:RdRp [Hubei permutotetra-like virus 11]|uniref:RdRp n=1 Tax=Hubei permutotetra-like virus 11 TaxID=1923075 RepID=UPI00090B1AE3|nr:RdRp [Hubei permutotetra-like virus 11]APG76926.1 RdRp [Hubei permutotetra-like virus 11]